MLDIRTLFIGWGVKLAFAFCFILIFTNYYGDGNLYGDAYNFINDSRILNEYAYNDLTGYLKLLFGFGEDQYLLDSALRDTQIWSYGDNGDFINDNRLIIRINSLIHFFSAGNFYVHGIIFSFFGYLGLIFLFRAFRNWFANPRLSFFLMIAFPSIAFWGSGITKEALMLLGMGLFFYGLVQLKNKIKIWYLLLLLIGGFILLLNKPHVGLVIITLSPFLFIGLKPEPKKSIRIFFPFICMIGLIASTFAPSEVNLLEKVSYKQKDLINIGKGGIFFITDSSFCAFDFQYLQHFQQKDSGKISVLKTTPGEYKLFGQQTFHPFSIQSGSERYEVYLIQPPSASYINVTPIHYSRKQMFFNVPEALFNTILRPTPMDPGSWLKYFSFASNILFLGLIIFAFINRKKTDETEKFILTYFVISALITLLLIGWTTPILGAIVRYKIAAELLLIVAISVGLKTLKNE